MKHWLSHIFFNMVFLLSLQVKTNDQILSLSDLKINSCNKSAIIFGVTGQDGAYLSELLLEKGYVVYGIVRRTSFQNTPRLDIVLRSRNAGNRNNFSYLYGDVTDYSCVFRIINLIKPNEVYNLAGQSHVKVSFEKPEYTSQVNAIGTLNILEAILNAGLVNKTRFYQASSSEMFGKVQAVPQNENTPFYPRSPYGVAKLYAHWIGVNYREAYGMFVCNGILFNHESPYRGETFVSRVISRGIAKIKLGLSDHLKIGNLNAKRDWGYAKDYVHAMWLMLQQNMPDDYVIATGETHSVKEFIELAFKEIGIDLMWKGEGIDEIGIDKKTGKYLVFVDQTRFRPAEVDFLIGDATKARTKLGWKQNVSFNQLVSILVQADLDLLQSNENISEI